MEGIEALMRHVYVFPVIGLVLGAIIAALAFISSLALALKPRGNDSYHNYLLALRHKPHRRSG